MTRMSTERGRKQRTIRGSQNGENSFAPSKKDWKDETRMVRPTEKERSALGAKKEILCKDDGSAKK